MTLPRLASALKGALVSPEYEVHAPEPKLPHGMTIEKLIKARAILRAADARAQSQGLFIDILDPRFRDPA